MMMTRPRATKTLRKEATYPHPPSKVWVALTDPRALAEWLMPNDFKPEVGHVFRFQTDPQPLCGSLQYTQCEVLELVPEQRMVWSWNTVKKDGSTMGPMHITWTLEPTPTGGTRLRFEQAGMEHMPRIFRFMMTFGWGTMIKSWIPKVAANVDDRGAFTPGAIPLEKRCYKAKTIPDNLIY